MLDSFLEGLLGVFGCSACLRFDRPPVPPPPALPAGRLPVALQSAGVVPGRGRLSYYVDSTNILTHGCVDDGFT